MPASPASYAVLGLPPGADRAAVDRAYRALMKRHHPDLGGDPALAASINHAYADITRVAEARPVVRPTADPGDLAAALYERHQDHRRAAREVRRTRRRWPVWLIVAALVAGSGWLAREALANLAWDLKWRYFQPVPADPAADEPMPGGGDIMRVSLGDAPLDAGILADAEALARRSLKRGGSGAAAETSRRCYIAFHSAPSLDGYDRCVAFDNAVILIGGDGISDRGGGFSAGAITARQIEAARTLDRDYESIETRINRLRLAMTRMLAALEQPATPAPSPAEG